VRMMLQWCHAGHLRQDITADLICGSGFQLRGYISEFRLLEPYYSVCFNDIAQSAAKHHGYQVPKMFSTIKRRTKAEQLSACSDNLSRIILEHQHFDWTERSIISLPVVFIFPPWVSVVSFAGIRTGLLEHRDGTP
jgi:hypothetical protein